MLGRLADAMRARKHPDGVVTYIVDRNVNYTNVCTRAAASARSIARSDTPRATCCRARSSAQKIDETVAAGGVQILLQGGLNPDLPLEWYEDLFRCVKASYPTSSCTRSRRRRSCTSRASRRLPVPRGARAPACGRARLACRAAAPRSSSIACAQDREGRKCTRDEWLDVMRVAHQLGLRTTATMMYGTVETLDERIQHMVKMRDLQDETGGFTAFICWDYQHEHRHASSAAGRERHRLATCARRRSRGSCSTTSTTSRRSWVTQGRQVGQLACASAPTTWAA